MPRKKADIHYIYKTTCNVTSRYYIGMHSTYDVDDGYMGSGLRLRSSIRKYGDENHSKEILEFFDTREKLVEAEKKAITPEMILDRNCMNLVSGGNGWNSIHNKAFQDKLKNDQEFRKDFCKKSSIANKNYILKFNKTKFLRCDWTGRKHSDATKESMVLLKKGTGIGEENSQYGTCWITNLKENKKIKKEELETYFSLGWIKGRNAIGPS